MALRDINLIPPDILNRKEIRRHLTFWTVCLGIGLCPVFGFYLYQASAAAAQNKGVRNLAGIEKELNRQAAKVNAIQAEIDTLNQQIDDLKAVLKPAIYSQILHKLAGNMNGYTWLNSLQIHRQKGSEGAVRLQMNGYAASNGALGNFLNRLSSDPQTDRVVLKFAKESGEPKNSGPAEPKPPSRIEFEIECTISRGA